MLKRFPNKLGPKVPTNIPKNSHFCSFVSILMVLATPFNQILESLRACMSFISSFKIIKVVCLPESCILFVIPASIVEAAAIPNGTKILPKELLLSLRDQPFYLIMSPKILQIESF